MKRAMGFVLVVCLMFQGSFWTNALAAETHFTPQPQTEYARLFVSLCEGQQWFIDEVERLLNQNQKSIDTLTGPEDLSIITSLGLVGQGIVGKVPAAIGELKELHTLHLSENKLSENLPDGLFALPKLQSVDLSDNLYGGAIPDGFGTIPALKTLMLHGNAYTGSIPVPLLSNSRITVLDVSGNKLTGGLPAGLSGMSGLQYLGVADNAWGGPLPDLSALVNLKTLSAWDCDLSGAIPDSLFTLSKLQILDLAGNSLTGRLSTAIGGLTELQLLAMGGNELTGPVPAELSSLTQLTTLDLSSNKLDGVLPDAFGAMDKLMEIHLEENKLRGLLPGSIDNHLSAGAAVHANDNYLTGSVLAKTSNNARNFCDGAATEQYRMSGPSSLTINENSKINVWPMLQNRNIKTGDIWLKPLLPIDCYTAEIENDTQSKVELTQDENGFYVKVVPLPPPVDPEEKPKKQEISTSENIRLTIRITDNTGSGYSQISILLTTMVVTPSGGGASTNPTNPTTPTVEEHSAYVDGYPDGRFGPSDSITREQAAKLVVTALGAELPETSYSKFNDVTAKRWSAPYIECSRKQGYLLGIGGGAFGPERVMTRAEFAACLTRVWGTGAYDETAAKAFPDVEQGAWYYDAVVKASAMGLVNGMPDGGFRPMEPVSRAEAVTILNRLLGRNPKTATGLQAEKLPFSDVADNHWARLDILEASIKHQHPVSR